MPKLTNVCKKFDQTVVFNNFNLTINEGVVTAVLGKSGVGKSTLLNLLAGILKADSGTVQIDRPVSYVFQTPRLIESITVYQNLEYVLKGVSDNKEKNKELIKDMLLSAEIWDKRNAYPNELSGGQKQRVSLVRAFLFPSSVMLMDEPFGSLDIALKVRLMNVYKHLLNENPRTVVFVSHDIDEALMIADEIIVLGDNGVIASEKLSKTNLLRDLSNEECNRARVNIYKALTSGSV